jgi:hypothetical protein
MIGFIIRACLPRRRYYRRACGYRRRPTPQEPIGLGWTLGLTFVVGMLLAGIALHLRLQLTLVIVFSALGVAMLGVAIWRWVSYRRKPLPAPPRRPPPPEPPRPQAYYSNRR